MFLIGTKSRCQKFNVFPKLWSKHQHVGIVVKQLKRFPDERGFFTEILRTDWKDLLGEENIAQANLSITYSGIVSNNRQPDRPILRRNIKRKGQTEGKKIHHRGKIKHNDMMQLRSLSSDSPLHGGHTITQLMNCDLNA